MNNIDAGGSMSSQTKVDKLLQKLPKGSKGGFILSKYRLCFGSENCIITTSQFVNKATGLSESVQIRLKLPAMAVPECNILSYRALYRTAKNRTIQGLIAHYLLDRELNVRDCIHDALTDLSGKELSCVVVDAYDDGNDGCYDVSSFEVDRAIEEHRKVFCEDVSEIKNWFARGFKGC